MTKNYFFATSILFLIFSVVAFSDNLFFDVKQKSNSDPKFIIHGIFCFAWFILFVIQTNFIRKGNYKAHIKFGIAGIIAAVGVFLSTVYIFIVIYKGWDNMSLIVKANRFLMLSFGVLVWLGYRNRKKPVFHKRFMFIATLYMFGPPILDRALGKLYADINYELFSLLIWNGLFISLFIYDWIKLKKIHPISWIGVIWFYCIWVIAMLS